MSRLIDADALMEYVLNLKSKTIGCNDIARFPTAYDIDKVIDKLKEKYYSCDLTSYEVDGSEYEDGRFDAYNDAIEIVKKGGTE